MSVQYGFLAVLTQGPAYGSQLQNEFLMRAANRRQLNAGQVYSTLDRMTEQGLIESAGETEDGLPLYRLTGSGEREAATWLTAGPGDARPDWDEMQDQVLIAASIDGADPAAVVADYRAAFAERIRELTHDADSRAVLAANRAAELGARAAIEWLDEVSAALETHPGALVQPRCPERPRRGRRPADAEGHASAPRTTL
ncbi:PadR family transcriptional regulator [Leifsonia shinshuensis]|uniref:PadR family transcriptional regulator n=1 Tax=Leifsonia shinshuensis TaxID=150026 RepID=UPI001F511902|nr:PadR family transcriptional regulator [Leifsonia shinshuensis]MCI0155442.1 PadR family transcriptional regulator [Leifsonia shinshuensis]